MNEILNIVLASNKFFSIFFALGGIISFFIYTKRGEKKNSNTFGYVLPVSLWMFVERMLAVLEIHIPRIWKNISISICLLLIIWMIILSIKKDFSVFVFFNIWGNLFVMYALPVVISTVLISVVMVGGGAAIVLIGIPLLAFGFALSESRIYD